MSNYILKDTPFVKKLSMYGIVLLVIGAAGLGAMTASGMQHFYAGYLLGFMYVTGISLTMLFFSALTYLANAGWAASIRRIAELFSFFLKYVVPIAILPIVFFAKDIYAWWAPIPGSHLDHLMHTGFKGFYLSHNFFYLRLVLYIGLWWWMHSFVVGNSLKQDTTNDLGPTQKNWKRAAMFVIIYAMTITFVAFDLVMSLEPEWFSTIFGVYVFAGNFVSTASVLLLVTNALDKGAYLKGLIRREHYHDLGKLMFAFTVFWTYIAFSQYYIIWYGNMPEETIYFSKRLQGGWEVFGWSSLFIHFFAPFLFLIRQDVKRNPRLGVMGAFLILFAHFIDLCWIILPVFGGEGENTAFTPQLLIAAISGVLLMLGAFLFLASKQFSKHPAVAYNDPYLHESLEYSSGSYDRI